VLLCKRYAMAFISACYRVEEELPLVFRTIFTWYNLLMVKGMLVCSTVSLFLLLMMMFFVSPETAGPLGIMMFFVLSYLFFLGLAVFCCRLFFLALGKASKVHAGNLQKKSFRYGSVLALAPVVFLLCASFGGVTILEVVVTILIEMILCFLVSRNLV